MAAISLQFVRGHGLGARLIQWFDHGRYSHVDSVMPDGSLLGSRNDTVWGIASGVQMRPAHYVDGCEILRVDLPCDESTCAAYYEYLHSQLGKPYDETAILAFVAGRDWEESDSWFCSELCAHAMVVSGFWHELSAPANKIAPDDLLLLASAFVDIHAHNI